MTISDARSQLAVSELEQWLWDAACVVRGPLDAPKFKDYILPLVFLKRLSNVFDDEIDRLAEEYGDREAAAEFVELDHGLVRFYMPEQARWSAITHQTTLLGEFLTDAVRAVARENERLQGVIDAVDFNATAAGQRIVDDARLAELIQVLNRHRLGLTDVEPDILGRAYEYLLRKFAEGQGQSAGEFYTPREVGLLMARLLDPEPGMEVYDPACGSAGLLIKCHLRLLEKYGERQNNHLALPSEVAPLRLYGQEINPTTYAIAHMNAVVHDMAADIAPGNTMTSPVFTESDTTLRRFDIVTANPMWNQKFIAAVYEHDPYARFTYGLPPEGTADWAWLQHMMASLHAHGRAAVVLDTNSVSRGSHNRRASKEKEIRKAFVESGLIVAVILLPENLFYNTGSPGIIILLDKAGASDRDSVRVVNASRLYYSESPKNRLDDTDVEEIATAVRETVDIDELAISISIDRIREVDYDLSPARHVPIDPDIPKLDIGEGQRLVASQLEAFVEAVAVRHQALAEYLSGATLAELDESWVELPLADAFADSIGGDWGEEIPKDSASEYVRCAVIRGTDFPAVSRGALASVPYRFLKRQSYERRQPIPGDIIVELSGGSAYQRTGRALYLDETILAAADPPLVHTNFTRRLRVDTSRFVPKYIYYYWELLYDLGRTARYEKQPTNIRNFKLSDFLQSETLRAPRQLEQQGAIVTALDAIHGELFSLSMLEPALMALRHSSMRTFMLESLGVD